MENMQNEENPSLTNLYDQLVLGNPEVLEANAQRMGNPQLIEFYEYCVEKSEDGNLDGCELYWYATLVLEEMPVVKMYKNGQLYVNTTLDNEEVPYMEKVEVTEEDLESKKKQIDKYEVAAASYVMAKEAGFNIKFVNEGCKLFNRSLIVEAVVFEVIKCNASDVREFLCVFHNFFKLF